MRKSAERGQCSQRPRSFWSVALPNSSASLKVPMGTDSWGRGWNEHKITNICARRSTWFTLLASMASFSSDKFSPKKNSLKDVQGYIHGVSDVKTPANPKSTRYFDFILQEGDEERRVVCFNANKHNEVKHQERSKLPVQLSHMSLQKRTYGEGIKYKMSTFSRLTPAKSCRSSGNSGNSHLKVQ